MYKVTNITKGVRRVETDGKTHIIKPNESINVTTQIPYSEKIFKVELIENRPKKNGREDKEKNKKTRR